MSKFNLSIKNELYQTLKDAEMEVGTKEIAPDKEELNAFCRIINDNIIQYLEENIFPPGYIMNLSNKVLSKVITKTHPLLQTSLSGYIHVESDVEFMNPMSMDKNYIIKVESSTPIEKEGNKASYYSVIFRITISDTESKVYVIDNHHFFFRL